MSEFSFYFTEGFRHITDWKGYDHILFVMALCLPYGVQQWRKVLVLVTAFTLGHSVTLALSVFDQILVSSSWIEFLIPVTIVFTALENLYFQRRPPRSEWWLFVPALIFGLIHGMGFSNYLKSMLGTEENILVPLLGFNVGLEIGQLLIIGSLFLLEGLMMRFWRVKKTSWVQFISGMIFGIALVMALERIPG